MGNQTNNISKLVDNLHLHKNLKTPDNVQIIIITELVFESESSSLYTSNVHAKKCSIEHTMKQSDGNSWHESNAPRGLGRRLKALTVTNEG